MPLSEIDQIWKINKSQKKKRKKEEWNDVELTHFIKTIMTK